MKTIKHHGEYYTPIQMKIPVDLEKIIEISDPIYTFNEIMSKVDLRKYLVVKGNKAGRPRLDSIRLLKIILFAFMEFGYVSLHNKATTLFLTILTPYYFIKTVDFENHVCTLAKSTVYHHSTKNFSYLLSYIKVQTII